MAGLYKFEKDFLQGEKLRMERKSGDTSYFIHSHDYYEIIYYKDCDGVCLLNGSEYRIIDSCLFLLTPQDFHRIDTHNHDGSRSTIISFAGSLADDELLKMLGFSARILYDPSEKTIRTIEDLWDCYIGNDKLKSFRVYHLFNTLLADVLEYGSMAGSDTRVSSLISKAMTIAISQIPSGITLTRLADQCGVTAPYLSDLFHKETGKTYTAWLTQARVGRASRMLEEQTASVLEICYECGYNTPSQFIKMFKRVTGMTPSEYRSKKAASK